MGNIKNIKSMKQNNIDRQQYEKDLAERQRRHLENVKENTNPYWQPCLHDGCPECLGTGVKIDGSTCIHMISCGCSKCSPRL